MHGWDLAQGTGQDYSADADAVALCHRFVAEFDAPANAGIFGPPVAPPDDAAEIDRLVGFTGRDPSWSPRP